jgi:hypothetical protein
LAHAAATSADTPPAAVGAPFIAARLFVSVRTLAAFASVMKSMYAAATSGCLDAEVIVNGSDSPPSETGLLGSLPGISVKPTFSPILSARSAVTHVPAIRKRPLPLAKLCHAGS